MINSTLYVFYHNFKKCSIKYVGFLEFGNQENLRDWFGFVFFSHRLCHKALLYNFSEPQLLHL